MNYGEKDSPVRLNLTDDELVARLPSRLKMMGLGNSESSKEASSNGKRGCGRSSGVAGSLMEAASQVDLVAAEL
jgi:hypothetical protein